MVARHALLLEPIFRLMRRAGKNCNPVPRDVDPHERVAEAFGEHDCRATFTSPIYQA
jgi:hypothetical protein